MEDSGIDSGDHNGGEKNSKPTVSSFDCSQENILFVFVYCIVFRVVIPRVQTVVSRHRKCCRHRLLHANYNVDWKRVLNMRNDYIKTIIQRLV